MVKVSDIFAIDIKASHFNLIACGSAEQTVSEGDEPLGIVTALLCAGASSVVGTMWPIQIETGKTFIKEFEYKMRATNDVVDIAVCLQETVQELRRLDLPRPYHWASFVLHGSWFHKYQTQGKNGS
jgi:CHAT domain-containing protein